MDISVIVPIYGVENYIERCLRSLFTQTKTDGVEFILVNDATPDNSMEIARRVIAEYPLLTVRILEHTVNRHVAATRQTGLDAAIGDYTIQIDSDDWCEPIMLEDMYARAIEDDADIVYCDFFNKKGEVHRNDLGANRFETVENILVKGTHSAFWIRLIKKKLYAENGVRVDCGANMHEDMLCITQLYYYADVISYLASPYYHYEANPDSITQNWFKYVDDRQTVYDLLDRFFREHNDDRFQDILMMSKIRCKYSLVSHLMTKDIYGCMKLFPDIEDRHILDFDSLSIPAKLIMLAASRGWDWPIVFINRLRILYHKMQNRA